MTILKNVEKLTFIGQVTRHRDHSVTILESLFKRGPDDINEFKAVIRKAIPAEYKLASIKLGLGGGGGSANAGGWVVKGVRIYFVDPKHASIVAKAFREI